MRRYVLTERQYDLMKRGKVNEANGYPKFLDGYFAEIYAYVRKTVDDMLMFEYYESKDYYIPKDTTYANEIFIKITLFKDNDILDVRKYTGEFSTVEFSDGKLSRPILNFAFPFDNNFVVYYSYMYGVMCHEVEHLYDEWKRYTTSGHGVNWPERNRESYLAFEKYRKPSGQDDLRSVIGKICYLDNYSERNAFATQTYWELKRVDCSSGNYNRVMKETMPYKNYKKIKKVFVPMIKNASAEELWDLNKGVFDVYPSSEIPKFDYHKKDVNDAELIERYRNKLIQWAERTFDRFMKKFYGVVYLYLEDELREAKMTIKPYVI